MLCQYCYTRETKEDEMCWPCDKETNVLQRSHLQKEQESFHKRKCKTCFISLPVGRYFYCKDCLLPDSDELKDTDNLSNLTKHIKMKDIDPTYSKKRYVFGSRA